MATHKLNTPLRVGGLKDGITVDKLDLVSISINFQPVLETAKDQPAHIKQWKDRVIVSCMLHHAKSGWMHTVTLADTSQTGAEAKAMWADLKSKFPELEKEVLALLQPHLPEGTIE